MRGTLKLLLSLLAYSISAQTESPINTDRPDQGDGTYILTKKSFQIEEGLIQRYLLGIQQIPIGYLSITLNSNHF
jgi:hypothetical protein